MILFKEDWAKYPTAIPHWNTKNRSWAKLVKIYKRKKIDNCLWPIALINPELANIDPHQANLTMQQKIKVATECQMNPWYFYREVLKIKPSSGGLTPKQYKADRGIAVLWTFHNDIDVTSIRLRQAGKSVQGMAAATWMKDAAVYNAVMLWFTLSDTKRVDTIREFRTMGKYLPDYIFTAIKGKDSEGQMMVTNHSRNNTIFVEVAQKDKVAAETKGRGFTMAVKFIDEVAEAANSHITIGAITGSSNNVKQEAKELGLPYGTMFMCTAGSFDREEARAYYKLSKTGPGWLDQFLDTKDKEDLLNVIIANGGSRYSPLIDCTFSWRQLGLSEEHFKTILADSIAKCNGDMDKVKREVLSIWSQGSVGKPLSPKQAELLFSSIKEPVEIERGGTGVMTKYYVSKSTIKSLDDNHRVIIAIDTSNANGRDACSITVKDAATLMVLARSDGNEINLETYGLSIWALMETFPNSVVIIENKSSAQGIIDSIILKCMANNIDPFRRFFNRIVQDTTKYTKEYNLIRDTPLYKRTEGWYNKLKGYIGFMTSSRLRNDLFSHVLTRSATLGGKVMFDKTLVEQLVGLEERNGRIDHPKGGHDDAAISSLFADWFTMQAINLAHYGFNPSMCLSLTNSGEVVSKKEQERLEEVEYLESVVAVLEKSLGDTTNTMVIKNLFFKLDRCNERLTELGSEPKSTEQLRVKLRSERANKRKKEKRRYR